jgi:hypothetical protein
MSALALLILLTLPCAGCTGEECTFTSHSTSSARVMSDGLGVNIHFTDARPGEIRMISQAGFRWVRMDLNWALTEPAKGQYDFAPYDRLMSAIDQYGIHALLILDYTNPAYDNGAPPRTEAARLGFTHWAVAAAKHFAGRGVIWETYNEPNHAEFWPPQPNSSEYVALALAVARAFRESVPAEKLIGPATSEIDFDFLEACFKGGLLDYWSAVSVHPYRRSDPETAARDYCRLRKLIDRYRPKDKQIEIFAGEWGYSAAWRGLNKERQGQLLARSWLTNAANDVALSIWYDWRDDGSDAGEPEHNFGTVADSYHENRDPVYDPKPAYLAAQTLSAFFVGYQFEKRIELNPEDYVLVFSNGKSRRLAAWTTGSAHNVVVPFDPGSYTIVDHLGQNPSTVIADQRGLVIKLTTSPVYLR